VEFIDLTDKEGGMKNLNKMLMMGVFFLAVVFFAHAEETEAPANVPAEIEKTTFDNLQTAFNSESNANARYLAFAKNAKAQGWIKSGEIFRALALAHQIYMDRYTELIKDLGGTPTAKVEPPVVKNNIENFKSAMENEIYETMLMYPGFLSQAQKDNNKDVVNAFDMAGRVTSSHAAFLNAVVEFIASGRKNVKSVYIVCPVCGNLTLKEIEFEFCPICGENKEKFIEVN
jgi:rubrerythrin